MDGITLDRLLDELRGLVLGHSVSRARVVSPHALALEISGGRGRWLWLDAGRGTAGVYALERDRLRALEDPGGDAPGGARHALLLVRKHLEGLRFSRLVRIPGERTVVLEAGPVLLVLRLSGASPAWTLALDEGPLATFGEGAPAWPLPEPRPEAEWDRIDPILLGRAAASGRRAILAACPSLGPDLARALEASPGSFPALRKRLEAPRPVVVTPRPLGTCHDADLAPPGRVLLLPTLLETSPGEGVVEAQSWTEAAAIFLEARLIGGRFDAWRRAALDEARREVRRLARLERHLGEDRQGLPDPARLRRQGEALLAFPGSVSPGSTRVRDPYEPGAFLEISLDPALSAPANADRLFERARRAERASRRLAARLEETAAALLAARRREEGVLAARDTPPAGRPASKEPRAGAGPRHYLTSAGLSLLVGRGARENHELTFGLARPEDLWLHARDVPGAHVILRDPEGRAGPEDMREAAEVAAFFSDAAREARADVHVTRRKHLRPGRGGAGRVLVSHSETLRVAPRDPEGRLRRR